MARHGRESERIHPRGVPAPRPERAASGGSAPAAREIFQDGDWEADAPAPLRTQVTPERTARIIARNTSPDIPFDRSVNPY
ncbi:hypothetical protein L6C91_13990, partial [Staphylococcus aureus]